MSELDGLEEIDLRAHGSTGSAKQRRKAVKSIQSRRKPGTWKSALHAYQTKKAKQVEK